MKPSLLIAALLAIPFAGAALIVPRTALADHDPLGRDKTRPAFQCTAETEGQLTCQANRVCECVFKGAELGRKLPARWIWDCGIKRPICEHSPAEVEKPLAPLPPVIIDAGKDRRKKPGRLKMKEKREAAEKEAEKK
ncbi:MAG: hypothetical protein V3R73_05700 [Sphingomonadales bacterium]